MKYIWRIFTFAKQLWPYYIAISIFTILLAAMSQVVPLFTKGAIDQITNILKGGRANVEIVAIFAALIFVSDIGTTIFSNIGGYLGDMMAVKLQTIMSQRYYAHLLSLPQSYFDRELTGKIINRMNRGINQITQFINILSNNFLQFIFSTIFSLAIVAYFSWPVAVMLFLLYPVFIGLTTITSNKWQTYQKVINEQQDIASGRFAEAIGQVKVVKSFIQESNELRFFQNRYKTVIKTTKPQSRYWHKQDTFRRLVLNVIFFAVFVYIFVSTAKGQYSLGTMVLLIQYSMLIRIPIFSISFLVDQAQRAIANTKDYFEAMDIKSDINDSPNATKLLVDQGEIQLKNVKFAYDHNFIINNMSFTVEPNTRVALVGESGEGKTTITNLLMRLYEPNSGTITIDNQDIARVTQASLRDNIGVVFQEPALFSGTVRDNIAYANPQANIQQIIDAAVAANADEFIEKFDKKYDTEIGERGLKLSGGQKQRLAIARALLKNAPILILDEATSSLDSKSERLVQQALDRLMQGRTTIIIAHRLSTIENVDKIITISGGQVEEEGSPDLLSQSGGIYSQLLALQRGHTLAAKKKLRAYDIAS